MKFTFLIFLISLALPSLTDKKDFVVSGYIRDTNGNLLENVDVHSSDLSLQIFSDSSGYYSIESLKDTIVLVYSYVGYKTEKRTFIKNVKRPDRRFDLIMQENTQSLDDVLVKGSRLQLTTSEAIDISNLKFMPEASGGGIESYIKTMQGVSSNNELSSQYSVRGGSYDENSVYVNGIEVYRPYLVRTGEQEGLSFVNPDMVGSVNFSAGGFDSRYGDKLSSVLDITYKKPIKFEAGISGSLLGASGYIGSSNGKFSQMHGIRYKNSSFLLGTLQTKAEYNPNFVDYQTYMTYKINDKVELSFLGNFSQNTYNFVPETRNTTFGPIGMLQNFKVYFSGQEQDLFRTIFGAFAVKYTPNPRWNFSWTLSSFYTDERVNYDIQGEYWLSSVISTDGTQQENTGVGNYYEHARNQMRAVVVKAAHDGSVKLTEKNTLMWGVDVVQEIVNENVREWEMRDSSGYTLPYNQDQVNLYYSMIANNRMNETRVHFYVQDVYKWYMNKGGIMVFTGGLRFNYWSFNNEFTVSPRATIAYFPDIKPDIRFRFSTGLYYQSPSYKEIKDTVTQDNNLTYYLNKDIKSQRSFQVIAGMDYYYRFLRRPLKLSVDVYYKSLKNIITYNLDNVSIRYMGKNDAEGYAAGMDVKLFGEFVPGVDSWISFSLMRTMEDVSGDNYGYIPRPMDQLYNISIFFQDYIPGLPQYRVHLLFNWAQGLPVGPPRSPRYMSSNTRMPDYRRVDIGVSRVFEKGKDPWMGRGFFKPFRRIAISLECLNLFGFNNVNSYYWVTDIFNQQYAVPNYLTGRQFNFKLEIDF
ncbi:MAG: TonB-dependent receptor [Paludibacteraceae bacterium]|nr:TonB-dependent receptor [Paludibacteraceae bacterium]